METLNLIALNDVWTSWARRTKGPIAASSKKGWVEELEGNGYSNIGSFVFAGMRKTNEGLKSAILEKLSPGRQKNATIRANIDGITWEEIFRVANNEFSELYPLGSSAQLECQKEAFWTRLMRRTNRESPKPDKPSKKRDWLRGVS
ncbi:hypothetical protein ABW19_dt0209042 [Dactylella cylindrospora]|nr:hypothetical protein ABW19_dt0209042 [Dactylella cylindrospora]